MDNHPKTIGTNAASATETRDHDLATLRNLKSELQQTRELVRSMVGPARGEDGSTHNADDDGTDATAESLTRDMAAFNEWLRSRPAQIALRSEHDHPVGPTAPISWHSLPWEIRGMIFSAFVSSLVDRWTVPNGMISPKSMFRGA